MFKPASQADTNDDAPPAGVAVGPVVVRVAGHPSRHQQLLGQVSGQCRHHRCRGGPMVEGHFSVSPHEKRRTKSVSLFVLCPSRWVLNRGMIVVRLSRVTFR